MLMFCNLLQFTHMDITSLTTLQLYNAEIDHSQCAVLTTIVIEQVWFVPTASYFCCSNCCVATANLVL